MPQIAKGSEEYLGNGRMKVTRTSVKTGVTRTFNFPLTPEQLLAWRHHGKAIQEAMPHLTDDEREFLMTGVSSEEWDALAGEDGPD